MKDKHPLSCIACGTLFYSDIGDGKPGTIFRSQCTRCMYVMGFFKIGVDGWCSVTKEEWLGRKEPKEEKKKDE